MTPVILYKPTGQMQLKASKNKNENTINFLKTSFLLSISKGKKHILFH